MMFGMSLFSRSKKSSQAPKTYRPWIDELESRVCPTSLSPSGIGAPPATLLPILTLNSQVQPGHVVLLTGNVTGDQNNAGITVTFGGAVTGSAMTDGDGNFSYTTDGAALGVVYAVATDQQMQSVTAQAAVAVDAPALNLSIAYGTRNNVTLTGNLTDIDAAGQTITFTGVVGATVVTDSDGNFTLATVASGLGAIDATETDLWGQAGTVEAVVARDAPVIASFGASNGFSTIWVFQGTVTGPNVQGLIIDFGDTPSLEGQSAVVQADGTFSFTCTLAQGENGIASAITSDAWGQNSNEALTAVG